jgi:BASS family bile acid:Na+ symporter
MEANLLTEIFLPLALGIIMLGMGLALSVSDFKRVAKFPKAALIGLINQLIFLPLMAIGLVMIWPDLKPEFAVGIILLAACPGGATSNLLTYLAKGDAALSITLTAISSLVTVISIPFLVNFGMEQFIGEGKYIALPVLKTMIQIMIITVIPVGIGMIIKGHYPETALKLERPVKIASAIFIILIILGAIFKDKENIVPFFIQSGLPALVLNITSLFVGFVSSRMLGLSFKQSSTISLETGIQNGTLAIAIATSATLLNNPEIAIPPAVYSLLMFITAAILVRWFGGINGKAI